MPVGGVTEGKGVKQLRLRTAPLNPETFSSKLLPWIGYLETNKAQGSKRAARSLKDLRELPVYPDFEDQSQIGQTKIGQAKNPIEKDRQN